MTSYIRIAGSFMIALGIGIYAIAAIISFAVYIGSLILAKEYAMATTILGGCLIVLGYALRKIFRDPPQKL